MSEEVIDFQFKDGDSVYSPDGRGVVLEAFKVGDDKRYLVRSIKIIDFIEPVEEDHVYSEAELTPVGECETCTPLTEDFDVGEKID